MMMIYKRLFYKIGNEKNGVIELFRHGDLAHLVKQKQNGTFFKWYK